MPGDPKWLIWTRELQAIAQSGLAYTPTAYDRERFERLRELASEMMAAGSDEPAKKIERLFAGEHGYATPKVDVRGAVFDRQQRLLMVRETADGGRWTLPGGWGDVNQTPAESVVKEIAEESGYAARVTKLAAVWDRSRQGHTNGVFSCWKFFFVCAVTGGEAQTSTETSEVRWFGEDKLPGDGELSTSRVLERQLRRMFVHLREPGLPTEFD